jgi:uncharacterized protein (DUF1778 family)
MATEQTSRLEARLPANVYATLKRAAELQGRSLTDFVVSAAHDAAQRAIEEQAILRLSAEDQRRFAEALIQPPAPNAALKQAKRLHLENVEVRLRASFQKPSPSTNGRPSSAAMTVLTFTSARRFRRSSSASTPPAMS